MAYDLTPPRDIAWYGHPKDRGARCDICPLAGNPIVPYAPPEKKLRLVIVGEGPGRKEIIQRSPFTGMTGEILNDELRTASIDRETAHVTNAALCLGDTDLENEEAALCCAPRLLRELSELPADVPIIVLGKAAARSVLGIKSILLARGFVWEARDFATSISNVEAALRKLRKGNLKNKEEKILEGELRRETLVERTKLAGRTILPTLHPTFAFIHAETWAPIFRVDLDRVARWLRGELTADMLADKIERVHSLADFKKRKRVFIVTDKTTEIARAMKLLDVEIACDIETERIKPLSPLTPKVLTVQLSDGLRTIVIGPWGARTHATLLSKFFATRKSIVMHNGYNFDQPALERPDQGVIIPEDKVEDTLVAHHTFASHYPQKLDHVVSTFLDARPWKVVHGVRGVEEKGLAPQHVEDDEFYLYGAIDAVLTILAWKAMQADLEPERAVYEHDKALGRQGKGMQVVGFTVDVEKRAYLSRELRIRADQLRGEMRGIIRRRHFQPSKLGQVRRALFGTLKAPMLNPTTTGLASTSNATLEQLRTGGDSGTGEIRKDTRSTRAARFAERLLKWRVVEKIHGTYVTAVHVHGDGRTHYTWRPYGTNSGRYSCRLQSNPRWSMAIEDRAREQYVASPDHLLFYFDLAQAEARFAANLSGDENFITTCKGDVHTENAKILFTSADEQERLARDPKGDYCPRHGSGAVAEAACNCGKPLRDIAKNAGFAVAYLAGADKVFCHLRANGFPVELEIVEAMLASLKAAYWRYYEYVNENVAFAQRHGYLRTAAAGRIRWFGFHPKPNEIANFPIQSGIADVMNDRLLRLQERAARACPGVALVAQVHDAAIFDLHKDYVEWVPDPKKLGTDGKPKVKAAGPMVRLIEETWAEPVRLKPSVVCREAREFLLPADIKVGRRWSDL